MKKSLIPIFFLLLAACQSTNTVVAPTETASVIVIPPTETATVEVQPSATLELPTPTPGTTATPAPVERASPMDGMIEVQIPAGILHMGAYDVNADPDEKPAHEVSMHSYWMDKVEVTNGMYTLCIQAGACSKQHDPFSQRRPDYFTNPEYRDYPVVNVTWEEATIYCTWAGRRLPTEAEWERAARGDDLRTYPWGDDLPSQQYANFDNVIHDTSRVGSYAAGASPYGILDMAGNVWEWVNDLYREDYYQTAPTADPAGPTQTSGRYNRAIRGGSYQDTFMDIRVSNRGSLKGPNPLLLADDPARYGQSSVKIGFRCAADQ